MREYIWGVTKAKLTKREAARRDRIARKVGGHLCGFVYCEIPGEGKKGWFYGPNHGHPFDGRMAKEINEACGL